MSITAANTVIDSKDIRGCVLVYAPGVVIRKSKITCTNDFYGIDSSVASGTPLEIDDVTITCGNRRSTNGIGETNFSVRRVNISGCENGFDADSNANVQDTYVHDLYNDSVTHTDAFQTQVGTNLTLIHNTLYGTSAQFGPGTSAFIRNSDAGTLTNVLIQNNLVAGGAYTVYCQPNGPGNNVRLIDNHFSTIFSSKVGFYGPSSDCNDEFKSGNVWHDGSNAGQPIVLD